MAMTEKQGGSDLRATTTRAEPAGDGWRLIGHKWFCSAPMSDAFLTLAQTAAGLTCFLVPRWRQDGTRNAIRIQRLKDKLGNRANASAEIEYAGAEAQLVGEDGHGVRTIIKMVHHTRLDAAISSAALMRQAVAQALHHAAHRAAFEKTADRPAADAERAGRPRARGRGRGASWCCGSRARSMPRRATRRRPASPASRPRSPSTGSAGARRRPIAEALECLGGNGYIEESILPRLYREAPVNSIWEGSGNVVCLDVLRTLTARAGRARRACSPSSSRRAAPTSGSTPG